MKTFSGKLHNIDESILSSTHSGKTAYVKDWVENNLYSWEYKLNADYSIELVKDVEFKGRTTVPVWIKEAHDHTVTYNSCGNTKIELPFSAKSIRCVDCDSLEKIETKGATQIDSLYFENCPKLDLKNLANNKDLKVKRIKFVKCAIEDLASLSFVEKTIVAQKCKKLSTVNPPENPLCSVSISECPVVLFGDKINLARLELEDIKKVKKILLDIVNLQELVIEDCDTIERIDITGNKLEQISIADCKKLDTLHIDNDCTVSLNLDELPVIKNYELPSRLSGSCTVKNIMTEPQIDCRKKFIRR